ncbi:hypothetical protein LIER_37321 [Lithospermum erythrorhizon]|uniref:Uncharacterized protein n=1 Tax=Lithospermum erythrorhizon TaxID=34254 RepID=A0AAV3PNT1_LITER
MKGFVKPSDPRWNQIHGGPSSSMHRVVGLIPIADADPGALEALRVSFCVPDHGSRTSGLILLRVLRDILHPRLLQGTSAKTPIPLLTQPWFLEPEYQGIGSTTPQTPSSVRLQLQNFAPVVIHVSPWKFAPSSEKVGVFPGQFSTVAVPKEIGRGSSTSPNNAEMISSLSTLGDKGMELRSYKDLLSSYEATSGSSSRADQLEGKLKALQDEKNQEAKALQCSLKTLASNHSILQEKYGASVLCTEAVRDFLESGPAASHGGHLGRYPNHRWAGGTGPKLGACPRGYCIYVPPGAPRVGFPTSTPIDDVDLPVTSGGPSGDPTHSRLKRRLTL